MGPVCRRPWLASVSCNEPASRSRPEDAPMQETYAIECRNVWKIFGDNAGQALTAARDQGLDKTEVSKRFGAVVGIRDVSIGVRPGEIFCIMGLSGSGKSTLVRHINRLIEPTAGTIRVAGEDVNALDSARLRAMRAEKIGMVFQNMALLPHRTVRENVALSLELRGMARTERDAVAEEKLKIVHLSGWGDRYPDELSGGMKQRVGLARAIAADPAILLMDEPFSALDPLIRRELQDQFMELSEKLRKTTVFITHDLDEAIRIGDRIAIMKDGEIVQTGTPEEIVTNPRDDYVKRFVEGISRLKLVHAASVMVPMSELGKAVPGEDLNKLPKAGADSDLDHLIELSIESGNHPIVVMGPDGRAAGIVTTASLLRGIRGRPAELS
jgi:glycine betaine/proline transport system ATP-binding protein